MGWLDFLRGRSRRDQRAEAARSFRAGYEAARNRSDNAAHWAAADGLSASATDTREVRAALRIKCRHEVTNSCYARGIVDAVAEHVVGVGPRLQIRAGWKPDDASAVEALFDGWWRRVGGSAKLALMPLARAQDGEGFIRIVENPSIGDPIGIDLQVIEADQVDIPIGRRSLDASDDGIERDAFGNIIGYWILDEHPGDLGAGFGTSARLVAARWVLHYWRPIRPGQTRGIPQIQPALERLAVLRRYTHASLRAAEIVASQALTLKTNGPPPDDGVEVPSATEFPIAPGTVTVLPEGYSVDGVESTQPTTTYPQFRDAILAEIARPFGMPFGIASGSFSGYNYSSGRLDLQGWRRRVASDQAELERIILRPVFSAWWETARLVDGYLPPSVASLPTPDVGYFWDGLAHVDPQKEATAEQLRLQSRTLTLAQVYASQGRDWREELAQLARERDEMQRLGLTFSWTGTPPPAAPTVDEPTGEDPET